MSALDLEPLGHDLTPHYELGPQLGVGSYGSVHRARERATGREVALKLLNVGNDPLAIERFLREAAVTANLDHPGIVRVHAVGSFSRRPAIVYELVEGEPLSRAMRTRTRAPRGRAALVRDAAVAVGHAHARGVVHRDLKPDNILVDAEGRVRVADFGLALVEGADRLTRTGALVGTPTHMAPERFRLERRAPAPTADVWSLGVVLYEALTGRLPFDGESMIDLAAKIEAGQLTPPRAIDRGLDPALEAVCLRALAGDPAQRQPDGAALAHELDEALAGRGRREGRRSRAWLVAVVALLTVVALGALVASPDATDVALPPAASDAPAVLTTTTPAAVAPATSDAPATVTRPLCEGLGAHWALWVDATRVVSGGAGLGVRLWDTTTGEVLRAWSVGAAEAARVADGTVLVSAQGNAVLHLDPSKDEVLVCFAGLDQVAGLTCAANAPRAAFFVGVDRRRALVIDTTSGRVVAEVPAQAQAWRAAALSSDGELLALSDDFPPGPETEKITSVRVFDVSGAAQRARRSVTGLCRGLGFDDRGRRLFVGSSARLLLVLDLHGDEEPWPLISATAGPGLFALGPPAHAGSLVDLAATADGRRLVSVAHCPGDLTEVKVWDLTARAELVDQTFTARGTPLTLDLSPDGRSFAIGVRDSGVHLRAVR